MRVDFGATLNIGPEIPSLPYLYTGSLQDGCRSIAGHGYQAVDLLVQDPDLLPIEELRAALLGHNLRLSAVATAGAWFLHRLHLCSPDPIIRELAEDFVARTARLAGACGGATIMGMISGILEPGVSRDQALGWLLAALDRLAAAARSAGSLLLLEPLNRRETNFLQRLDQGVDLLMKLGAGNVRLLADIYHIHADEPAVGAALRAAGPWIGHIHIADDNRRAPGFGRMDFEAAVDALRGIDYHGCVSVEAMPWPDSDTAARCAVAHLRRWFADAPISTGANPYANGGRER
jgi:sugar phosphate isomerase/epimerase